MSDYQVTNYGMCGECKWHTAEKDREKLIGYYCGNGQSEHYGMWTQYTDTCEEWEQRGAE